MSAPTRNRASARTAALVVFTLSLTGPAHPQSARPAAPQSPAPPAAPSVVSVKALVDLARTQMRQKNAALALQTVAKALALAPNSEEVLLAHAEAALAARLPLKALPSLEALGRLAPTEARYRFLMGQALLMAGDAEAATPALEEAERLDPRDTATLVALGTALNRRSLFAEAKAVLLRASTLDPDAVAVLAARAEAEAGLGERDAAEARAERALARSSGDSTANLVLGEIRLRQERYAEARRALEKAAVADAESPVVQERLAAACEGSNDALGARRHRDLARQREKEREARVKEARRLVGYVASEGKEP